MSSTAATTTAVHVVTTRTVCYLPLTLCTVYEDWMDGCFELQQTSNVQGSDKRRSNSLGIPGMFVQRHGTSFTRIVFYFKLQTPRHSEVPEVQRTAVRVFRRFRSAAHLHSLANPVAGPCPLTEAVWNKTGIATSYRLSLTAASAAWGTGWPVTA